MGVITRSLDELKISPEVGWYLENRGIPLPTCVPKFKTPEPRSIPGAWFDEDRVDLVIESFDHLRHTQGKWAGKRLHPDPWQIAYILAPVYGWVRKNDAGDLVRIIRTEYVDVPRKNGKTTIAGGQAIILTGADGEAGAQVYAVAVAKDQARFCFDPVKHLVEKSPDLKDLFKPTLSRVVHRESGSYFAVVSSLADLIHGANVHGAVIDELHKHKTRDVVEAVETGTGARDQPLVIIITTADDGRQATIYAEKREYCEHLAAGTIEDPTFYGVIWAAEEDDDPFVEATWKKANPGYGISPTREFMESAAKKAQDNPASRASFLRLHLGLRTKQETKYLELADWDRNASLVVESKLGGQICYGGLDLSTTTDLTAFALDFPDMLGGHDVLYRLWLPEGALGSLDKRTAGNASVWVRNGYLSLTPGNVVDYDFVRAQINKDREAFQIREIAYDPWNSSQIVNDLEHDGALMVTVRQGFASMSGPTKELLRLLKEGTAEGPRYRHGGNPAVRWQVDNFAVAMDPAGNVKPDKATAGEKIDGLVAGIMALDRAFRHQPARRSAYEDHGLEMA